MSWIAVHTKPKAEHVAVMNLRKQGYGVYLPLAVEGDGAQPVPMFPNYVFVDTDPLKGLWRPIRSTRGVSFIVMTGEAPSRVPVRALELLQRRSEAGVIRLRRIQAAQSLKPGQTVRVHEGDFTGFEGVFERMSARDRVVVLLDFLGGRTPFDLPASAVA